MDQDEQHKRRTAQLFDRLAAGYDTPALRLFPFCADRLVDQLRPRPATKLLDVATGTGAVAVSAAQALGPRGRVTGIDLSESMLDRAAANIEKMALTNVDLHAMDAGQLEFRGSYFDYVVCSFGLFFLPDMTGALREWLRVVKPGGTVLFSTFGAGAFQPLAQWFAAGIAGAGGAPEGLQEPAWLRLACPEVASALLAEAGAIDIQVHEIQLGYHLAAPADWWEVVWNSGFRRFLDALAPEQLAAFRESHLETVAGAATEDGIWLNLPVLLVEGRRPV